MSLIKLSKEELELLSYTDLTELILKNNKGAMNTASIFKEIAGLLELSDSEYAAKIGDFYTSLTTDKRFIFLEDTAEWDLRTNHSVQVIVEDDDEEEEIDEEEIEEEEEELIDEEEEDLDSSINDEDDLDDGDDDISDLAILTEEELEEN